MNCSKRARREAGLSDFGDNELQEPLRRLLGAMSAPEADLSLIGRFATQWDIVRFLINLLRFKAEETAHPEIMGQTIRRPVFITGLPRSGTTFLHRLMMTDPANRAPLVWETIFPWPDGPGPDRREARVAKQLKTFEWLAPEFRALHPLDAEFSAGMQRNHRACVPQPAFRYELPRAVLSALAGRGRRPASARVSFPQALFAPSAIPGWSTWTHRLDAGC